MKIYILYESKYSLSTMNENKEILSSAQQLARYIDNKFEKVYISTKRTFFENIKESNNIFKNFKYADITKNTVLGILARLMGDIRRIEDIGKDEILWKLENKITFENKNKSFQNEIIRMNNQANPLQNGSVGVINSSSFLINNNVLSEKTFGIFYVKDIKVITEILSNNYNNVPKYIDKIDQNTFLNLNRESSKFILLKTLNVLVNNILYKNIDGKIFYGDIHEINKLETIKKNLKDKKLSEEEKKIEQENLKNIKYNKIEPKFFYAFLFIKYINYLRNQSNYINEYETLLNPALNVSKNSIKGIASETGFITEKDLFSNISKPNLSWSFPLNAKIDFGLTDDKKEGKFVGNIGVTKECGQLIINIDLSKEEAIKLYEKIDNAGVNTFHLGKKGLAYVSEIILEE